MDNKKAEAETSTLRGENRIYIKSSVTCMVT
nr:MAG TPA: hypothetical protein [Caudoviricetes sp.]